MTQDIIGTIVFVGALALIVGLLRIPVRFYTKLREERNKDDTST